MQLANKVIVQVKDIKGSSTLKRKKIDDCF